MAVTLPPPATAAIDSQTIAFHTQSTTVGKDRIIPFIRANRLPVPASAAMIFLQRLAAGAVTLGTAAVTLGTAAVVGSLLGSDTQKTRGPDPLALLSRPSANLDL
jgi:hypothetical protein